MGQFQICLVLVSVPLEIKIFPTFYINYRHLKILYLVDFCESLPSVGYIEKNQLYCCTFDFNCNTEKTLCVIRTEDLEASTLSEDRLRAPGDSQESLVSYSVEERTAERKVWSREAFTHETAGMGGPDLEIKTRYFLNLWS